MPAPQLTCNACNCKSLPNGQRQGWRQLAVDEFGQLVLSRYSRELRRSPGSGRLLHTAFACGKYCTDVLFKRYVERGNFTAPPRFQRSYTPGSQRSTFAPAAQQRSFSPSRHPQSKPDERTQIAA
jgi:hypothetical protein